MDCFNIEKIKKFGGNLSDWTTVAEYNSTAWRIFLYSNDRNQINAAIRFMKEALNSEGQKEFRTNAAHLDTYANLLYKVGRIDEAIKWEQQALAELIKLNNPYYDKHIQQYKVTIENMKMREPTYIEKGAIWNKHTLPKK